MLAAAGRLLAERGPAQVTLREIADAAQVNVGLIHRHIGSKDALVRAVVDRFIQRGHEVASAIDSWDDLVALVFTPTESLYDYTHLLAWLVLEGVETGGTAAPPSPLEELAVRLGGDRPEQVRDEVAALVSLAYGWQLFTPYLARALRYEPGELDGLRLRFAALAAELPRPSRGGGLRCADEQHHVGG